MKKIIMIIIVTILAIITLILGTYKILTMPVSKNIEEKQIEIPMGSGANKIAEILKNNNLIRNKLAFKIYVKLNKISNFKAGTYYLKESMSLKEIAEMLQTGIMSDPNQITITYLEGKPMWWLAEIIETKTNNSKEDVYNVLANEEYIDTLIEKYWFLTDEIKNKDIYYSLEGYLFPDTYSLLNEDIKVEEIFEKMLNRMEEILEPYKQKIEENKYTIHQLLTLASIVETEGMNREDRVDIASVFYNRLEKNMSLGSCVTTYYSAKINMGDRDLYQSEIDKDNPYNTRGPGMEGKLPVGPISSVSKMSLDSVINPADTDYLFFVSDKNGKLYFTKTYSEHQQMIKDLQNKGMWYEY